MSKIVIVCTCSFGPDLAKVNRARSIDDMLFSYGGLLLPRTSKIEQELHEAAVCSCKIGICNSN